jgi:hypothetical protein
MLGLLAGPLIGVGTTCLVASTLFRPGEVWLGIGAILQLIGVWLLVLR